MEREQIKKKAKQMFEKGKSYSEISKKLNISESTLKSWKRRDGWDRATPPKKRSATPRKTKRVAPKGLHPIDADKSDEEYNRIKANLLSQLKTKGAHEDVYIDLVNDYMSLWKIKNQLIKDINERGVQVRTVNSSGIEVFKKNDSVIEVPKYNNQMLKLLNDLGLSASEVDGGDDDDL